MSRHRASWIPAVVLALAPIAVLALDSGVNRWLLLAVQLTVLAVLGVVLVGRREAVTGPCRRDPDEATGHAGEPVPPARSPAGPVIVHAGQAVAFAGYIGPPPPSPERWSDRDNVVELHDGRVHLTVEVVDDRPAVIDGLDVRLTSCDAPPHVSDVEVVLPAPLPPDVRSVSLSAKLPTTATEPAPSARPSDGAPDFPYPITPPGPRRFHLHVTADAPGDFRWRVGVHWVCGERSGVTVTDDQGRPFRFVRPEPRSRP